MTYQELKDRCQNRNFDRIIVVVSDIFEELAQMQRIREVIPGDIRICTEQTHPGLSNAEGAFAYTQRQAVFYYQNTELCIVEPVAGETLYKKYLDRFGPGICCVRERVSDEMFRYMESHFEERGCPIAQRMEDKDRTALWVDLMDELGILFELMTENSKCPEPKYVIPKRIEQINITTPDVKATIMALADYLEIGPWEVGHQKNSTTHDTGFLIDGELKDMEFDFLLAIIPCGNIEWEVIEPLKGHLVYNDFLDRHGIGYHHVLQEILQDQWNEEIERLERLGIHANCKGSLGPIDWIYMDTEKELKFYSELRSDAVMDQLPKGYLAYFYPEPEA